MAKLRKLVTYTDYRWEETEELTPEQLKKWESKDENLQEHEKVNGKSPVNLISLKELNPFNLGYFIASWEHRVFLTSCMLQINPFDQYGVSAGKIFARKYLDSNGG